MKSLTRCVFALALLFQWHAVKGEVLPAGDYVFHAQTLRLPEMHIHLPTCDLLDYTGKNNSGDAGWQAHLVNSPTKPTVWVVVMEQSSATVRREIQYWIMCRPAIGNQGDRVVPVFANEAAFDQDTGICLFRSQSMDWSIRAGEAVHGIAFTHAAYWVRDHLDQVFDVNIVMTCADYFFHHPGNDVDHIGYSHTIACMDRAIVLHPHATELYTDTAWLLWSDWVTWTQDPNRIPVAQDHVQKALRLIEQGRAANPNNGTYLFDAANTLMPLAKFHRPDLMDLVIGYYCDAEALTTDKTQRVRIRTILGHRYRLQGKTKEALHWYHAALELDPSNKIALRYVDKLK